MAVGDVWQASATSPVTENSDTYTLLNDMTLTPGEAGDYLIWFSSSVKVDSVERDVFCAVFVGGTIETNSERYILEETSMTGRYGIIGTFWYATGVGATEAIEIRVKTSSASTNFDFLERTLIIRRVNSSDIFHNSHLSEQQISGAEAQLTNCTQTPGAGDYVAWFSASVHNGSTAITHARTRMFINAVAQTHTERQMCCEGSFPNTEHILASHMKIANLGASEVVEVKGYRDGSTMSIFGKALTLHKEDEGNVIEKTATDEQTVTSSTYATIPGMTDTPGAGDYLVFFSGNFSKSSGSSNTINIAIAKDAWNRGFDELNFDYVRFPSDGNLKDMSFPIWDGTTSKSLVIKEFFKHLRENLPEANLSVDLFGLSTVDYGLGVGQIIENAYQYFDFVCPMVYPSHYAEGFLGYQNPAEYPHQVVKRSMEGALQKLNLFNQLHPTKAKLRPWLQDFDLGATYDKKQVRLEINAVSEALGENFSGFMLWNSENIYTKEAPLPAE